MSDKLKWVDYGIAGVVNNQYIEVNRNLKSYPKLLKEILKHEKEHLKSKKLIDFWLDLNCLVGFKNRRELINFLYHNPKVILHQLIPFDVKKKRKKIEIGIDLFGLLLYLFLLFLIILWISM